MKVVGEYGEKRIIFNKNRKVVSLTCDKKVQNDLQGCKDERFLVILDSASTGFGMC